MAEKYLKAIEPEVTSLVSDLTKEGREELAKYEKIKEFAENEGIHELVKSSEKKIASITSMLGALEFGYIPVLDAGWVIDINTKSKYRKRWVSETMKNAPPEAIEALEAAKAAGVFEKIKLNARGPDPIIVGCAGKENFLIASWLCLPHGNSVGIRYLPRQK